MVPECGLLVAEFSSILVGVWLLLAGFKSWCRNLAHCWWSSGNCFRSSANLFFIFIEFKLFEVDLILLEISVKL